LIRVVPPAHFPNRYLCDSAGHRQLIGSGSITERAGLANSPGSAPQSRRRAVRPTFSDIGPATQDRITGRWHPPRLTIADDRVGADRGGCGSIVQRKDRVQVARAMQHADDFDAFREGKVKDDIPAHRKTSQTGFEFVTRASHVRLFGQCADFPVNSINEGVGARLAVIGDVIPDFRKVSFCPWAFNDDRHSDLMVGGGARTFSRDLPV